MGGSGVSCKQSSGIFASQTNEEKKDYCWLLLAFCLIIVMLLCEIGMYEIAGFA
jgi:hypothetical protein